ncbi:hypothetical protein PIIN_00413 [Serendipita indica DSM 11827]|uniref:SMP-30/Gluconolactonase/LRE-like region domain-containing protein n=1 Tax=Serendipita indica (strain DSM 11827) TaxID=1109443 RepID=G4T613_SERID|nr:hypothetical protein PIIN_00413 [Serendipita indica DSM 11827]
MSTDSVLVVDTPLLETGCILGEGPLYEPSTGILHFVDIKRCRVYHYDTNSHSIEFDEFEEPVTALALRQDGLACVTATGFALIEKDSESKPTLTYLSQPLSERERKYTRLNDGACDARGRFLAGTLESKAPGNEFGGVLYQYDPATGLARVLDDSEDITDGNGLGWSEDNSTLYFTSSCANLIYAYDYNLEDGSVSNRRVFIDGPSLGLNAPSFCDGLCIDSEGCIWSARWAGSKIVRFSKEGRIIFEIQFPKVFSVTALTFGGPENDWLFVTTAHPSVAGVADSDKVFAEYPDSGHLFKIDFQGRFKGGVWRHSFGTIDATI